MRWFSRKGGGSIDLITIKHLELLQAVIARLSNSSFLMKGWSVTVAGVFFGFAISARNWRVATIGELPILAFWGLDAFLLSRERLFRAMYAAVLVKDPRVKPLSMDYSPLEEQTRWWPLSHPKPLWWRAFWSKTICLFYLPGLASGAVVILLDILQAGPHWK